MRAVLTLIFLLLATGAALAAGPAGHYRVRGNNADGTGAYAGEVTVVRHGQVFDVTWTVGTQTFTGTGIGGPRYLAVGYVLVGEGKPGIAIYRRGRDGTWSGTWAGPGFDRTCVETWTPQ